MQSKLEKSWNLVNCWVNFYLKQSESENWVKIWTTRLKRIYAPNHEFPKSFPRVSQEFPHSFFRVSPEFPQSFLKVSPEFPQSFPWDSQQFPQNFPWNSQEFPKSFPDLKSLNHTKQYGQKLRQIPIELHSKLRRI